jgi:hypothetical protein
VAIGVAAVVTVAFGAWPGPALEWAAAGARGVGGAAAALAGAVVPR